MKRRHAARAFDGEGARLWGGRWNRPGFTVVYASESRALATLEVLVAAGSPALLTAYVLVGVGFDADLVTELAPDELPQDWNAIPCGPSSQALGDDWLDRGARPVLRVPSVVVQGEFNYLLNPAHADFAALELGEAEDFPLDPRLFAAARVGRSPTPP